MPDLSVWPTDGGDGAVSSEARWRRMARLWVPSGVDSMPLGLGGGSGALAPTLVAGPTINVAAGGAWLDGHYAELTAPASVPVTANGLLVVRFTPADNHAELLYRDGAGLSPTQTDPTWELPIAQMTAGAMTDLRTFATPWRPAYVPPAWQALPSLFGAPYLAYAQDATTSPVSATESMVTGALLPADLAADPATLQCKVIVGLRITAWGTCTSANLTAKAVRTTEGSSGSAIVVSQITPTLAPGPNPAPWHGIGESAWTPVGAEARQSLQMNMQFNYVTARPSGGLYAAILIRSA